MPKIIEVQPGVFVEFSDDKSDEEIIAEINSLKGPSTMEAAKGLPKPPQAPQPPQPESIFDPIIGAASGLRKELLPYWEAIPAAFHGGHYALPSDPYRNMGSRMQVPPSTMVYDQPENVPPPPEAPNMWSKMVTEPMGEQWQNLGTSVINKDVGGAFKGAVGTIPMFGPPSAENVGTMTDPEASTRDKWDAGAQLVGRWGSLIPSGGAPTVLRNTLLLPSRMEDALIGAVLPNKLVSKIGAGKEGGVSKFGFQKTELDRIVDQASRELDSLNRQIIADPGNKALRRRHADIARSRRRAEGLRAGIGTREFYRRGMTYAKSNPLTRGIITEFETTQIREGLKRMEDHTSGLATVSRRQAQQGGKISAAEAAGNVVFKQFEDWIDLKFQPMKDFHKEIEGIKVAVDSSVLDEVADTVLKSGTFDDTVQGQIRSILGVGGKEVGGATEAELAELAYRGLPPPPVEPPTQKTLQELLSIRQKLLKTERGLPDGSPGQAALIQTVRELDDSVIQNVVPGELLPAWKHAKTQYWLGKATERDLADAKLVPRRLESTGEPTGGEKLGKTLLDSDTDLSKVRLLESIAETIEGDNSSIVDAVYQHIRNEIEEKGVSGTASPLSDLIESKSLPLSPDVRINIDVFDSTIRKFDTNQRLTAIVGKENVDALREIANHISSTKPVTPMEMNGFIRALSDLPMAIPAMFFAKLATNPKLGKRLVAIGDALSNGRYKAARVAMESFSYLMREAMKEDSYRAGGPGTINTDDPQVGARPDLTAPPGTDDIKPPPGYGGIP